MGREPSSWARCFPTTQEQNRPPTAGMIYWRAHNGDKYGSGGDFSALRNSGGAKLELASQLDFRREKQYAIVSLHSPTDQLTFSILPGEAKTVTLNFYIHQLNGEAEYLRVDSNLSSLYNKLRQTIPLHDVSCRGICFCVS